MHRQITSGLPASGILPLLLPAGPSLTDTVEIVADGFGASDALAVSEIVYEDVPSAPARWDVTADGTSGLGGLALIRRRRSYN